MVPQKSQAPQISIVESDRGRGGWFGDPEGHSEASRRGWEERRDNDYEDRRRR
ncbi:hypothetical protein [Falsochrobactrum shanghaiense]|uniref:hypothetical protein n=1 Tax=Falsochrobactrum shanghaiense TaxID=2201899 RepID=UPI0013047FFC|nr:hypothetical protein [Falsochrobactrum shanghaiense]